MAKGAARRLRRLRLLCGVAAAAALIAPAPALAGNAGPIYKHVSYGPSALETATIYSQKGPNAPIVILVHGGGWRLQKTGTTEEGTESKALQLQGFTVFNIDYDQDSPTQSAFPLETDEIAAASEWAIANAASYGGDPANVVMLGGSAGALLVARVAEQLDAALPGTVRAVVSLSGPMNFSTLVQLAENKQIKDKSYVFSIGQALGCSSSWSLCSPILEAEFSPALNIPASGCPDWLLLSSEIDTTATLQADEMLSDLEEAGCSASLSLVAKGHGFSYWGQVTGRIFEFLRAE